MTTASGDDGGGGAGGQLGRLLLLAGEEGPLAELLPLLAIVLPWVALALCTSTAHVYINRRHAARWA